MQGIRLLEQWATFLGECTSKNTTVVCAKEYFTNAEMQNLLYIQYSTVLVLQHYLSMLPCQQFAVEILGIAQELVQVTCDEGHTLCVPCQCLVHSCEGLE